MIPILLFMQVAAAPAALTAPGMPGVIRINQLGYLPDAPKVAIFCSLAPIDIHDFQVSDAAGKTVLVRRANDVGDYSTNEPIMDGTANLSYLRAALAAQPPKTRK